MSKIYCKGGCGTVIYDEDSEYCLHCNSKRRIAAIEDAAIESGMTTKDKIDEAEKAQEIETEKFKQHVFEYQRYSDLSQVVRHLLGALKQLNKYKDKRRIDYWAGVAIHWEKQIYKVLENKDLFHPPLTKQLLDELDKHIEGLRKLKAPDLKDLSVLVDDIQYRLSALYGSFVTLEGTKQYAIEKRHSDLVEYIQNRIKAHEQSIKDYAAENPGATEHPYIRDSRERADELRGLIYHDNQSK